MCLVTTQKKPKVAKKNITVYKALNVDNNGFIRAVFQHGYHYELGKLNSTKIKVNTYFDECFDKQADICFLYTTGFHSSDAIDNGDAISISEGFHSAKTEARLFDICNNDNEVKIFKCTIPSGALYYEDFSGLVVSNEIIINEIAV
jgi:hypothetical protein